MTFLGKAMYKHILIATDGSELAGKAVTTGLALAKQLNAKVTAITAIEPWLSIASSDTAAAFMEYQKAAEQDAARILGELSTMAEAQDINCETVTVTDGAAEAIIETANNKHCDLIVARQPSDARADVEFSSGADLPVIEGALHHPYGGRKP